MESNGFAPAPAQNDDESKDSGAWTAMDDGFFATPGPPPDRFASAAIPTPVVAPSASTTMLEPLDAPMVQTSATAQVIEDRAAPAAAAPFALVEPTQGEPAGVEPAHAQPQTPQAAPASAPQADAPVTLAPIADVPEAAPYVPSLAPEALMAMEAAQAAPKVEPESPGLALDTAGSEFRRATTEHQVSEEDIVLQDILLEVLERGASDLHLTTGSRPMVRISGELESMEHHPVLTPPVIQRVMYAAITQRQREKFEAELELDFAYSVPGRARFRVNLYRQRDALGAAFRLIPYEIKPLEALGVPPSVSNFAMLPRGFVLVTGPTGSGKSTTLAAIIDMANRQRRDHILTVEDPIEFLHRHQGCLVNQREVGEDTHSFSSALKHSLRQDPDIILVGEMRDLETISVALTAAETGHLVFATLHTQDAAQTIDRVIDVFPANQQQQVRVQLAGTLQGIVCQTLAKTADGRGRAVATEVLVATPAIRNLIREGKTHQIYSSMQAGAQHGMHTMDQHLADLVNKGRVTYDVGLEKCHHLEDFNRLTGRS